MNNQELCSLKKLRIIFSQKEVKYKRGIYLILRPRKKTQVKTINGENYFAIVLKRKKIFWVVPNSTIGRLNISKNIWAYKQSSMKEFGELTQQQWTGIKKLKHEWADELFAEIASGGSLEN